MQYNYYSLYNITEANVLQNQRDAIFQTQQKIRDEQRANNTKPVNVLRQGLKDSQRTSAHLAGNRSNAPTAAPAGNASNTSNTSTNVLQNQRDAIFQTQQKIRDEQRANNTKPVNVLRQGLKDSQRTSAHLAGNRSNAPTAAPVNNGSNTSNTSTNRSGLSLPSLQLNSNRKSVSSNESSRKQKIMSNLSNFRTRSKRMFSRFRR